MNSNYCFMAFAGGKESTEGATITRYIGVAPVTVLAVNPNKSEQETLFNTTLDKEPEYIGNVNVEGADVKNVRISFVVKTVAEKCDGIDFVTNATFFIQNRFRKGSNSGKTQVIDKYGNTAWAMEGTDFEMQNGKCVVKQIPMYSNGPANIDIDYRPCYVGEEDLTNFIKAYLNIPNVRKYVDGKWVMNDNPIECEARLDGIENYFKGDFSELRQIITFQPNNKVKLLFGVRTDDNGREYQAVYTQMALKNGVTDYSRLDANVQERKNAGAYSTTEFAVCPIKEYVVTPTSNDTLAQESAGSWF